MLLAVPRRVQARVPQPEVGRQVDDDPDPVPQPGHDALRLAVGQRAEHEVQAVEVVRVGRPVAQPGVGGGQRRRVLPHHLTGVGVRGDRRHLDLGVAGEEPQELHARVP